MKIEQYYIVEDCGTILDHEVVEGQVHGAVAQGMGNAIFEELIYTYCISDVIYSLVSSYGYNGRQIEQLVAH